MVLGGESYRQMLDRAAEAAKGIFVKKPLASGPPPAPDGTRFVAASFALVLSHPGVASAVVGTIDAEHLRADARACERALAYAQAEPSTPLSLLRTAVVDTPST